MNVKFLTTSIVLEPEDAQDKVYLEAVLGIGHDFGRNAELGNEIREKCAGAEVVCSGNYTILGNLENVFMFSKRGINMSKPKVKK